VIFTVSVTLDIQSATTATANRIHRASALVPISCIVSPNGRKLWEPEAADIESWSVVANDTEIWTPISPDVSPWAAE
jgi:hypothetical protein